MAARSSRPLPISCVSMLRAVLRREEEQLLRLSDDTPLEQLPKLWETVADGGRAKWVNAESLVAKGECYSFVESKLLILLNARDRVTADIAILDQQMQLLMPDVAAGEGNVEEETPPENYSPWRLRGPQHSADLSKIDQVNWWQRLQEVHEHEAELDVPAPDQEVDPVYWDNKRSWIREKTAYKSLKAFNYDYLEIKRSALETLKNQLTAGAETLIGTYMKGYTELGASRLDLELLFKDKDVIIPWPRDLMKEYNIVSTNDPILDYGQAESINHRRGDQRRRSL